MRLIAVSVLGLVLAGCASSSGIRPEQEVSVQPYADRVEAECIKYRAPESNGQSLSDSDVQKLCQSQAGRFASVSESYMSIALSPAAIERCKEKGPEQETACIVQLQENFYENNANTMIQKFQAKQ